MIRFRVRRARQQSFLPRLLRAWERRAPEVAELIRQAFWRGIPTRGVGGVVALVNLRERGLLGEPLQMIISDGGTGWAAALETVYPRALHQRCGVHKMRNICEAEWPYNRWFPHAGGAFTVGLRSFTKAPPGAPRQPGACRQVGLE